MELYELPKDKLILVARGYDRYIRNFFETNKDPDKYPISIDTYLNEKFLDKNKIYENGVVYL